MSKCEEGRVAVVTGAGAGIGRQIALQMHEDNFAVVVNDVTKAAAEAVRNEIVALGGRAVAVVADVSDAKAVDGLIEEALKLGKLYVMVANAGINIVKPFIDITEQDLERLFAVNVNGVIYCNQAAARVMIEQGEGGRIINAASAGGKRGYELLGGYSATKFATIGITQTAALELAQHGITVNAYCPGAVDTDMWDMIDDTIGARTGAAKGETLKARVSRIPMGRAGQPQDVADLVSFLASDKAGYMTGQSIVVDGGVILS